MEWYPFKGESYLTVFKLLYIHAGLSGKHGLLIWIGVWIVLVLIKPISQHLLLSLFVLSATTNWLLLLWRTCTLLSANLLHAIHCRGASAGKIEHTLKQYIKLGQEHLLVDMHV